MKDWETGNASGVSNEDDGVTSEFKILRTFSMPRPGHMAQFMNGLNWQAAWLGHHFHWVRMVVGYALTDIPERVLEIYGVPQPEKAGEALEALHAQPEYGRLLKCCREDLPREEELLPALSFETRLEKLIKRLKAEAALVARGKAADTELERLRAEVATADATITGLEQQIAAAQQKIAAWILERNHLLGQTTGRNLAAQIRELNRKISAEETRQTQRRNQLQVANAHRTGLVSQQATAQRNLDEVNQQLQEAMDPENRKKAFDMMINIPAYFLNVTIHVKPGRMEKFIEGMRLLARDFKWDFLAAGKPTPGTGDPRVEPGSEKVMNLWGFTDANNLYRQMIELRENERFADIEKLTGDETQILMCDWEALAGAKRSPPLYS